MKKQKVSGVVFFLICLTASAQIRTLIPVVRPVYGDAAVQSLNSLAKSLNDEGYEDGMKIIKAFLEGSFGSGFVFVAPDGRNYAVTNRHVVRDAVAVTLQFQNEDGSQAEYSNCPIVAADKNLDLALVAFPKGINPFKTGLEFSDSNLMDGDEVWSAGYPGLDNTPSWQLGKGNITNRMARIPELATTPAITALIQHSAQIDPGNSGGPLLIADRNKTAGYAVIGINTWKARGRQAANFSIPAAAIENFINETTAADETAVPVSQTGILEARCRALAEDVQKENAYQGVAPYISAECAFSDGGPILLEMLSSAPTQVRNSIIDGFGGTSPIEGMRLAIAYKIQQLIQSRNNGKGKEPRQPFKFISIDGDPEIAASAIAVRFGIDEKEITVVWSQNQGIWLIQSWPFKKAAVKPKEELAKRGRTAAATEAKSPYSLLVNLEADLPPQGSIGFSLGNGFTMAVNPFATVGFSWAFGNAVYAGSKSSSEGAFMLPGLEGGLQLPINLGVLHFIPFARLKLGYLISTAAPLDSQKSGAYVIGKAGIALGLGDPMGFCIGVHYQDYLISPNLVGGENYSIWIGYGL